MTVHAHQASCRQLISGGSGRTFVVCIRDTGFGELNTCGMMLTFPTSLITSTILLLLWATGPLLAQSGATKAFNPFHQAYHDSLQAMDYPYKLPILGKGAYKKGYDIPFPLGVGIAYFAQRQRVEISSTQISFNDSQPVDLTGVIEFGNIVNYSNAWSIRPNFWILPFVNLYAVFAAGNSQTEVPLVKPINFTTTQEFRANTAGVGATLAGGFHGIIVIVDQNYNWVDLDAFVEPVPAYNLDMRVAHNFVNARRADRSLTIWFGAFYQQIKNDTKGTIYVKDLFPGLTPEKKDEIRQDFDQWYDDLSPAQHIVIDPLINHIKDFFDGKNPGDGQINYFLDKKLANGWNMIFGAQYQHNKTWQLRTEVGTFGERTQFLINLNYAFLSFHKRRSR